MPFVCPQSTPAQNVPNAASRFVAALILPHAASSGALAIIDHSGALILQASLPADLHRDARDSEGLLAHLTLFIPRLSAITDIGISWLPAPAPEGVTVHHIDERAPQLTAARTFILPILTWLGPNLHIVQPTDWLGPQGIHAQNGGGTIPARNQLPPEQLLSLTKPDTTDDTWAAVVLAHHCLPFVRPIG